MNPNCHCLSVLRENFCFNTDLLISTETVSKAHLWSILVLGWSVLAETRDQSFRERQKRKAGLHKERERSYGGEIMPIPCKSQEVPKPVINLLSCKYCMTNTGISCPSKTFLEIPASPAPNTSYHKFSFLLPRLCLLVWCNTSGLLIPWVCWGLQTPTLLRVTVLLITSSNGAGMTNTSTAFFVHSPQWDTHPSLPASTFPNHWCPPGQMGLAHTCPCIYAAKCLSVYKITLFFCCFSQN